MSPPAGDAFRIIGRSVPKVDGPGKVSGQTQYADDLALPRMLWMKLARSPHAHARIVSIDTSEALAMPGVISVLTGADFPIPFGILPVSQDEHALCLEKVRFVGDPVAAVAALDEETAMRAAALVRVEYEVLPGVFSIEVAVSKAEPRIHDYGVEANVHRKVAFEFGDLEQGFAHADLVMEDTFFYGGNTHLPMETHASLAMPEADGRLTIWSSTQTPHYLHRTLSKVLEMPPSRIRVIATPVGGGFGGKSDPFSHEIVVAKLALLTGRPVKVCLTREEVFLCHRGRHPVLMQVRTGVTREGRITATHWSSFLDGGAYGSYGVASTFYTGALQTVTYDVGAYKFDGVRVFTNKPPCGPKRGHGTPQPRFGLEVQLDKIAERLELDPAEMRKRHLVAPDTLTANHLHVGSMGLGKCIDAVVEGSRWRERWRRLGTGRGLGLACGAYICGAGLPIYWNAMPHTGVLVKLDRGGGVTVYCGQTDIGQGSDSVLAQVVAEVLGVEMLDIRLVTRDTDLTPVDLGSYSSRVTLMMGNAALQAAGRARDLLAASVSKKLEVPANTLVFAENRVFVASDPAKGLAFAEAVQFAEAENGTISTTGSYTPPPSSAKHKGGGVGPSPAYSYSAAVAEVEVDSETGLVRVEKIWIGHDIGRALNPALVIGQVEGGVYMGLGEALMESQDFRVKSGGLHKAPSMLEYKSPTIHEMCEVETYLIEEPDRNGPFGAKEVGQGPLLAVPPAIANAIHDAIGVRIDEVPITPEKILKALAREDRRVGPSAVPTVTMPEPTRVPLPDRETGASRSEVRGHEGGSAR